MKKYEFCYKKYVSVKYMDIKALIWAGVNELARIPIVKRVKIDVVIGSERRK